MLTVLLHDCLNIVTRQRHRCHHRPLTPINGRRGVTGGNGHGGWSLNLDEHDAGIRARGRSLDLDVRGAGTRESEVHAVFVS